MLYYEITNENQLPYHLEVAFSFIAPQSDPEVVIPFWRPGRYEAGFFPKNYSGFQAKAEGAEATIRKKDPHTLVVSASKGDAIEIRFTVYARDLTAGNTFSGDDFLLINPVNSLVFVRGLEKQPCRVSVKPQLPWEVATAMKMVGAYEFEAPDMQALMDTPLLFAPRIERLKYKVNGKDFFIHIFGEAALSTEETLHDFEAFTRVQMQAFGGFPVNEYHFIVMLFPYRIYHGVEHENSTVIIYGPSDKLSERRAYLQLLGVSSHELYHTWNVKYIRPKEWTPYDFDGWGFSRLGYVAEGVTTYMGDLMLWRAGLFSDEEFLGEIADWVNRHRLNEAANHTSLADSSIDTWVDGYVRGTPRRKFSIYTEGALLAFICDVWIMQRSGGHRNLSTAMRRLFEVTDPDRGYDEETYWEILEFQAGASAKTIRAELVDGKGNWEKWLNLTLAEAGMVVESIQSTDPLIRRYGMDLRSGENAYRCFRIFEGSPAERAGLWFDDVVLSLGGIPIRHFDPKGFDFDQPLSVKIRREGMEKTVRVIPDSKDFGISVALSWTQNDSHFRVQGRTTKN